jgi:rubredoxin
MYICELCKRVISPYTKEIRIPVEIRTRKYPNRSKEVSRGRGQTKTVNVPGGTGYEIVREVVCCPDCAEKYKEQPKEVPVSG